MVHLIEVGAVRETELLVSSVTFLVWSGLIFNDIQQNKMYDLSHIYI